jgi:hypothetical protein
VPAPAAPAAGAPARQLSGPVFSQPEPTPDPGTFVVKHPSDNPAYKEIDQLNKEHKIFPLPFPAPRGGVEPQLTLLQVLGGNSAAVQRITKSGQLVFHATGDCGSTSGPKTPDDFVTVDLASRKLTQYAANDLGMAAAAAGVRKLKKKKARS